MVWCIIMSTNSPDIPRNYRLFAKISPTLINFKCAISVHFQPICYHAICLPVSFPVSFKDKRIKGSLCVFPSLGQTLAQFMLISPVILPAAGVHFTNLGDACRSPSPGNGRREGTFHYTISKFIIRRGVCYSRGFSTCMTESKRRANIEKIQARQRRYHAMGRCWCGRAASALAISVVVTAWQTDTAGAVIRSIERTGRCNCGTRLISFAHQAQR